MAKVAFFIASALLLQIAFAVKVTEIPRKKLAGPPSEFGSHTLPGVLSGAIVEDSAYYNVKFAAKHPEESETKLQWSSTIMVDSSETFTLSVFNPLENDDLKIKLTDPEGNKVNLHKHAVKGHFLVGELTFPETTYYFESPKVGAWKIKITTEKTYSGAKLASFLEDDADAAIMVWNKSPTRVHAHLNTYNLFLNSEIGLLAAVTEDAQIVEGVRPNVMKDVISDAELDIILPDGKEIDVQMHDDGLHGDLEANDGIYGASITATEPGTYTATAFISGTRADGTAFVRTSQHLIPVVQDSIDLTTTATGTLTDKEHLSISVQVTADQTVQDQLFRAYAEVYGTDASGNQVAVCWIGGMVEVQTSGSTSFVELELDLNWLAVAKATYPLTLKNVVIQETSNYIPLSQESEISVQTSTNVNNILGQASLWEVTEITKEMRQGRRTRPMKSTNATADSSALLLIHGYCSGSNPWTSFSWTSGAYFLEANANMNNEQFATKVYNWAESQGYSSYGLVGHSQGGMVGLHLLNYFETGLDDASGSRLLQSLGTPYRGCSAAGSAANLGKLFGAGCGSNTDLSTDGAKLWLAGISSVAKQEVHYYTTTYEQGKFFGDWCNLAMNAVLEWPNDGTTELENAHLDGATYMGNTEKQCHTTDMGYPAQYLDAKRNAKMNADAAR